MKTRFTKTHVVFGLWLRLLALLLAGSSARAQTTIVFGQTVSNTTTNRAQFDEYRYAGSAGQVLALGLWGPISCGSGTFMVADIYSPSGQLLRTVQATCVGGGGASLPLTNTGSYTILVHEKNYAANGNYMLSLQSSGECSPILPCDQTANSQISLASEIDGLS